VVLRVPGIRRTWFHELQGATLTDMTVSIAHDHVGITVTPDDLDATIAWYGAHLGFTVDTQFTSHGTTFTFLVSGNAKIELLAGASNGPAATIDNVLTSMDPSRLHHFCLAVDDLDDAVAELQAAGIPLIGGPIEIADIGQRIAFVTDNLGTIIELTSPGTRAGKLRS
jgi:catechol 2,3-dioxygenase-like lactoylglutathione lyase family enzyme